MISRRAFLGATAAAAASAGAALVGLSRKSGRSIAGGFVDDGGAAGHRLRDGTALPAPHRTVRTSVVIVGGGIAGLSAAWQLERRGMRDFVLLEMERSAGGNARWGENEITPYPWAAHYIPVPGPRATLVRELLAELGVLRDGRWDERHLCFAPQERLFLHGEWHQGVEPEYALPAREREDFRRFAELVSAFRAGGDFTIPMALGARPSALDGMSMAAWLDRERLVSPALRWYVDYACRDDYGARAGDVSAWAGIHYFASREPDEEGPLTWPEGNGWVARRLIAKLERHIVTGAPVHRVERRGAGVRVLAADAEYLADAVVFAAPGFLAPRVVEGERPTGLVYSPWLTANLVLDRWPAERGTAPAWDNVLYDSPALGYVVANHQSLRGHEERWVWTYYWALADLPAREARALLLSRSWREWTELILADLARAHPDIRDCVSRVDIMRMGHAMVRPVPGFLSSPAHARAPALGGRVFWAHSDASGLSLFEEAQYRGVAAADGALALIGGRA
ncbi:MAG TPA: FAD-dependent oxidoreductase [Gemmatimonadaceae bacterium]|nr:FAD-dependent oxidoreductase [Gemmatimonadaceae bacterium]